MSKINDINKAQKYIERELKKIKKAYVEVGIRGNELAPNGTRIVDYALANEFGSPKNNIPARSFFRTTVDDKKDEWLDNLQQQTDQIFDLRAPSAVVVMSRVGAMAVGDIKDKISGDLPPPNAASTRRKKGGSEDAVTRTLIDTGAMRSSVGYKLGGLSGY